MYGFNTYEPSSSAPRGHQPRRNGDFASLINSIAYEFSFCKDFSGGKRALVEVFITRLHGRALSECLMRLVSVVVALEPGQLGVGRADAELAGAGLVKLVAAGGVGAPDATVIFSVCQKTPCFAPGPATWRAS